MDQNQKNKSKYSKIGVGPFKCISCHEEKDKKEFSRKQILKEEKFCRGCNDKIVKEKKIIPNLSDTKLFQSKQILCYNCKKYGHKKSECIKKGGGAFNPGGISRKI